MEQDEQSQKNWRAGETFFEESGGKPAKPAGAGQTDQGSGGDSSLPASEVGTGIIPEDEAKGDEGHLPASEADMGLLEGEDEGPVQSWPGSGGPGTIPPPG